MKGRRLCAVFVFLTLVACAAAREQQLIDRAGWVVHRDLLPHSQDARKRVELFWTRPAGDGPYPVLLLVHGHQEQLRNGGEAFVRTGRLGVIAARSYVAAALSQPGYGDSDGPPDYCGPFTQDATMVAIDFGGNRSSIPKEWRFTDTAEEPSLRVWWRRETHGWRLSY
jgi:hypothetical protein